MTWHVRINEKLGNAPAGGRFALTAQKRAPRLGGDGLQHLDARKLGHGRATLGLVGQGGQMRALGVGLFFQHDFAREPPLRP